MTGASLQWLLEVLSLIACVVAVVRVFQLRLHRAYPFFAAYFLFPLILQTIVVGYGDRSPQICFAYPLLEPLRSFFYVVVVWEVVGNAFRSFPGIRRLIRAMAAVSSVGLVFAFVAPGSQVIHGTILSVVRFERGITCSLAIFTAALLGGIWKCGIWLPRNNVVLLLFWGIWFLGDSAMLMAASLIPAGTLVVVNGGLAVFEIVSCVGWARMLRRVDDRDRSLAVARC